MTDGISQPIKDALPEEVWSDLQNNTNAMLVDCRTSQEWQVIGRPDLSGIGGDVHLVEWKQAPAMAVNPNFAAELEQSVKGNYPATLYFICRSGARSREAATYIQDHLSSRSIQCTCVNVAEGFEGKGGAGPSGWRDKNLPSKHG